MAIEPGNGDDHTGPTGIKVELTIYINGRSLTWDEPTISFDQVVEQWNRLDPERHVQGALPGITWETADGDTGTLYRDESMDVADELKFRIPRGYLA